MDIVWLSQLTGGDLTKQTIKCIFCSEWDELELNSHWNVLTTLMHVLSWSVWEALQEPRRSNWRKDGNLFRKMLSAAVFLLIHCFLMGWSAQTFKSNELSVNHLSLWMVSEDFTNWWSHGGKTGLHLSSDFIQSGCLAKKNKSTKSVISRKLPCNGVSNCFSQLCYAFTEFYEGDMTSLKHVMSLDQHAFTLYTPAYICVI